MLLAEAGCVFMGFILFVSGVQGRANRICAFKGSSVDLPCSAADPTSTMTWYTEHWNGSRFIQEEILSDGNRITYNTSAERRPTLTISDLRESDANVYCCSKNPNDTTYCWITRTELHVTDLQVKVIPSAEGNTVTLMCSTSCPLTGNPAAYIWYKNRQFLYQDWSPWYQQLVSSEEAATYSCAVRGYEELRAPQVSVDSVTPSCFSVTYAKGRMCSDKQTSEDEPCSITYPTEVHVQRSNAGTVVRLICYTSCPLIDSQTAFSWYRGGYLQRSAESPVFLPLSSDESYYCAVKDHKDLLSAEICGGDKGCWRVNYARRRICALEGSSVNISSEYSHPKKIKQPKIKFWYKVKRSSEDGDEELTEAAGQVEYHGHMKNHHILSIGNVQKNDSGEYKFSLRKEDPGQRESPGVMLSVTGLRVKLQPAVVSEGHRVTVTCITSCPLPHNTNYIWSLNGRPLTLPGTQNKHLVLDPVSSQHAGNYVCAVSNGEKNQISREKTLTVQSVRRTAAAAAAAGAAAGAAAVLVIIAFAVFLWIRKSRSSGESTGTGTSANTEQQDQSPMYENVSAPSAEQDDHHYSRLRFPDNHTDDVYSTLEPMPSN